ncbi:MAG: C4-dicarboxylate transporter DcuC [Flavobacterium sp.]
MQFLGPILSLLVIILVATLLLKKYQPHAILLIAGLFMLTISLFLNKPLPLGKTTGFIGFDLFLLIKESFKSTNAGVGLLIMSIGGFVAYIDKIGASRALVYVAMKPLHFFKSKPYVAASLVIPIGQLIFIAIPSAAGLSLLLMASLFPILINLGVSRLTAASVISATTAICLGPASAIVASASSIIGIETVDYFVNHQIALTIPLTLTMMIAYYFVNRYFDKKEGFVHEKTEYSEKLDFPKMYALIPILPIILLIVFSELFTFFSSPIHLDTTTAMFISLFIALVFELIRVRNVKSVLDNLQSFWNGMGNIFKTVVTLIIAAEIFSHGLINLGFIDGLIQLTQSMGLGATAISIVMSIIIFLAAMLMGSGNAAFFSFGPLIPSIAAKIGVSSTSMLLPMQFSATMGRTVSPVAGIIIAVSEVAKVSTMQLVKRNIIPLGITLIVMLFYHFI